MHVPRLVAAAAAAGLALAGVGTAAASAAVAAHPKPALRAQQIDLHAAYEAHLGHTKPGRIAGIVWARGKQPKIAQTRDTCSEPNCPLDYNGGHVQQTPKVYLLFWGPNWSSDSSQAATATYLEHLCDGLGVQTQDNWSTTTDQYSDGTGHPFFSGTVCRGFFQDTSTPPTGVTQSQLAAEADAFYTSQGLTDKINTQVVVATQSGTCPQGFYAPGCFGGTGNYCAWHSYSNEPYTNLPYVLDSGGGCGEDFLGGTYDGVSMVEGHEYAETITDPYLNAWYDNSNGQEIGDKCAWSNSSAHVGLSTGSFAMQPLYSNAAYNGNGVGCVMSTPQPTDVVTVSNPGSQSSYYKSRLTLQVNGSSSGGFALTWSASGLPGGLSINSSTGLISGQITGGTGTYAVTVGASDTTGASNSASFTWQVQGDVGSQVKNQASAKCLNDLNGWVTAGNPIVIWKCISNGPNEDFSHPANPGELVVFGQCLTDPGGGGASTSQVIEPCTGASNQIWNHNSSSEYVLQSNGLCLTDPSATNGTVQQVQVCKKLSNQKWQGS